MAIIPSIMTVPVLAVPTVPAVLTVNKYHVEQRDYPADDEVDILLHIIKTNTMNFSKQHY